MCNNTPARLPVQLNNTTKATVDGLYDAACARHYCYEDVAFTEFCEQLLHTFGDEDDKLAPQAIAAFSYARSKYGYLSPCELEALQAEDWEKGICRHGLDFWTCPAGCFEY